MARKVNDGSESMSEHRLVDDVEVYSSPSVTLVLDARYFPVIIGTWFGHPDRGAADAAAGWVARMFDRAVEEDVGMVLISDGARMVRPSAEIRATFARNIKALNGRDPGRFLGLLSIAPSAFIRAFMARLLWAVGSDFRISTLRSMPEAINQARQLLESFGTTPPASLRPHGYERPRVPPELDVGGLAS